MSTAALRTEPGHATYLVVKVMNTGTAPLPYRGHPRREAEVGAHLLDRDNGVPVG